MENLTLSEVYVIVTYLIYTQLMLLPMLGLLFLGIRNERKKQEQLLKDSLKALMIVGVSKGRHIR